MKYIKYITVFVLIFASMMLLTACGTPTNAKAVGNVTNKQIDRIIKVVNNLESTTNEDLAIEQISPIAKTNNYAVKGNRTSTNNYVLSTDSAVKRNYLPQKIGETINKQNNKYYTRQINADENVTEIQPNENKVKNYSYTPKYVNEVSENFTSDNLQKYLAQIEDLYTYCSDCISANAEYELTKECLKNCCNDCKSCCEKLQNGTTNLTSEQIESCNNCLNKINSCIDKLNANKGELNKLVSKIKPLIKNYANNITELYHYYGQINQKLDTKIDDMNQCCDSLNELCDIVCGNSTNNAKQVNKTNKNTINYTANNLAKRKINQNINKNVNTNKTTTNTKYVNRYNNTNKVITNKNNVVKNNTNNTTKNNTPKAQQLTKNDRIRNERIRNRLTTMQNNKNTVNTNKVTTMQNKNTNQNIVKNNQNTINQNVNNNTNNKNVNNSVNNNNLAQSNNIKSPILNNNQQRQNAVMNNSGQPIINGQYGVNNYAYPYNNINNYGRNIDTYQTLPKNIDTYQDIYTNIDTYGKNYVPPMNNQPNVQEQQNDNIVATPVEENKVENKTTTEQPIVDNNTSTTQENKVTPANNIITPTNAQSNGVIKNNETLENSIVDTVHRKQINNLPTTEISQNNGPLPNPFDPQKVDKLEQEKTTENLENKPIILPETENNEVSSINN